MYYEKKDIRRTIQCDFTASRALIKDTTSTKIKIQNGTLTPNNTKHMDLAKIGYTPPSIPVEVRV